MGLSGFISLAAPFYIYKKIKKAAKKKMREKAQAEFMAVVLQDDGDIDHERLRELAKSASLMCVYCKDCVYQQNIYLDEYEVYRRKHCDDNGVLVCPACSGKNVEALNMGML